MANRAEAPPKTITPPRRPDRRSPMPSPFTTFASSRFVDSEAVQDHLRVLARRLKQMSGQITAVHLFGSFASGTATPHSDADVAIETSCEDRALCMQIMETAQRVFSEAPVPVEVHILPSSRMQEGHGIAGAVAKDGLRLA